MHHLRHGSYHLKENKFFSVSLLLKYFSCHRLVSFCEIESCALVTPIVALSVMHCFSPYLVFFDRPFKLFASLFPLRFTIKYRLLLDLRDNLQLLCFGKRFTADVHKAHSTPSSVASPSNRLGAASPDVELPLPLEPPPDLPPDFNFLERETPASIASDEKSSPLHGLGDKFGANYGAKHAKGDATATTVNPKEVVTEELLALAESMRTIVPKGAWENQGSDEEIKAENYYRVQQRPLIQVQFDVPRQTLVRHHLTHSGFLTKDASEDSRDLRAVQNPLYNVFRDEVDVGVQAIPSRQETTTQTYFARKVNASVQAEPTLVDACIRHVDVPKKESPNMTAFLNKVLARTLHNLTLNYEVPIYTDDFSLFKEDDAIVGARDDIMLQEKGNYTHAATKDRHVSSISWRSSRAKDNYVCVASIASYSLEERIDAQQRCESSVSIVWEFPDPMHPRYILESSNEVQTIHFSPAFPNLIAGGAMNGQVYLWDLNQADDIAFLAEATGSDGCPISGAKPEVRMPDMREVGDVPPMPDSVSGVALEKDGDVFVPRLQPFQVSRVELSHRRPVHDLKWLPPTLECTFDGKQVLTEKSHQFATVSDDGVMFVWDCRPEHLPQDKLRKLKHQMKGGGSEVPWIPLLRYQLAKPDGSGDMMAFRFFFDGMTPNAGPSYSVGIGSTTGEFASCSLVSQNERSGSAVQPIFGNTKDSRIIRRLVYAHGGPVYCVERHPLIGDVFLTCGDNGFKVWRAGLELPLYRSPTIEAGVTCAAWSPGRPAMVFIGRADGKIEVWDLLDRNNEPLLVHHMVQDAITTIAFKPLPSYISSKFTQQVAIGTNLGSFHWYNLPAVLSKAPNGEKRHFRAMLEREVRRAAYYLWRWSERSMEMDRYGSSAPKMVIGSLKNDDESENAKNEFDDDYENFYAPDPSRNKEFLELVEENRKKEEEKMKDEEENQYCKALVSQFFFWVAFIRTRPRTDVHTIRATSAFLSEGAEIHTNNRTRRDKNEKCRFVFSYISPVIKGFVPTSRVMSIRNFLRTRYSTKKFDPSRKISPENVAAIKDLLRLSPSSVNAQPWHFFIASTPQGKDTIAKSTAEGSYSFNTEKVKEASHVVVLCRKTNIDEKYLADLIEKEAKDGRFHDPKLKSVMEEVRGQYMTHLKKNPMDLDEWMAKQVYLSAGMLLMGVAAMGIDAVPVEGFNSKVLDAELKLADKGLTSELLVPMGYRSAEDLNASLPKSRLDEHKIITEL
eukprot:gene8397-5879_t